MQRLKTLRRRTRFDLLEIRRCLTTFAFVHEEVFELEQFGIFGSVVQSITAGDLDGDGDQDLIVSKHQCLDGCGTSRVSWYENTNGRGQFGSEQPISDEGSVIWASTVDLDGDGDLDVVFGNYRNEGVSWYENTNGLGAFDRRGTLATHINSAVSFGDIDNDGDLDFVGGVAGLTVPDRDSVAWFENRDSADSFSSPKPISSDLSFRASSVALADVDGDSDLDVILECSDCEEPGVRWYENSDGKGNFERSRIIRAGLTHRVVYAGDIDTDGDVDVVMASARSIVLHRNVDGLGNFDDQVVVGEGFVGPHSVRWPRIHVADIDDDRDLDIAVANENTIIWHENENDSFELHSLYSGEPFSDFEPWALTIVDIDGDGDLDVPYASWGVVGISRQRLIGDSNNDNRFDSADLVAVFQKGEYENPFVRSTFDEGDWNQDGDFDSADLVFAFQAGTYTFAAKPLGGLFAAAIDLAFDDDDDAGKAGGLHK